MDKLKTAALRQPELFVFTDGASTYYGPDQEWYPEKWQQQAGCGPTVCSQLVWYLSKAAVGGQGLWPAAGQTKEEFLPLMLEVWNYVTPGMQGTNTTGLFSGGAVNYAKARGVSLAPRVFEVGNIISQRSLPGMVDFLVGELADNVPVAFMNLSNGKEDQLESWHWVNLISFNPQTMVAQSYDNGQKLEINMKNWLGTSLLGGGLVSLRVV
ncbi:MAG: hypothetical protein ACK5L3_13865 [Oscillospiraceae bacterium]